MVGLATAATLCKEPGITVLAMVPLYHMLVSGCRGGKAELASLSRYSLAATILLAARLALAGSAPVFSAQDNPASFHPDPVTRHSAEILGPLAREHSLYWLPCVPLQYSSRVSIGKFQISWVCQTIKYILNGPSLCLRKYQST